MLDLTPIVARAEAARAAWPGPWHPYRKVYEGIGILSEGVVALSQGDRHEEVCWCSGDDAQRAATAEFIADAPADLAALVAEVERLRAAIALHRDRWRSGVGSGAWVHRTLWEVLDA